MSNKDEYVRKMHARLDQLSAEIDALVAKADQAEGQLRAEYHGQIESLRGKWEDARKRLNQLQEAGEGAWEDLKAGVEIAWEAIGEAIRSVKSRFK